MPIRIKRVHLPPDKEDGVRILIDRLWPRGVSKQAAKVDRWIKEIAPSTELRQWFRHDPDKWDRFKTRYFDELHQQAELCNEIRELSERQVVTLVYASAEEQFHNASALLDYLRKESA